MRELPEYVDGLPNLSGAEALISKTARSENPVFLGESTIDFDTTKSACAIALHMHQPLIPAGGHDLRNAEIHSNLKYMMDHQEIGDNHNAPVFHWCYKRMGEFIPQLVDEGQAPRVMLDYSGCLLHGLRDMGAYDLLDSLKTITCDERYRRCVEWLGTPWGHALAPTTPVQDYRLHVQAWQHHFGALFGLEALGRVNGFSPAEMALPNHPDVCYEFVKTLKDLGFTWVLVQEHSIEQAENGWGIERKHIPHRLVARSSRGENVSIVAIIKTQGNDAKLIAQMQPYYEAKSLEPWDLAGKRVPPLVTQIGDGENGGEMMNEFPLKYIEVVRETSGSETPLLNVTEYLEHLFAMGIAEDDLPVVQPVMQHRLWERFDTGGGPKKLTQLIKALKREDDQFHMEGGRWTNNPSWVKDREDVLDPIEKASALFSEKVLEQGIANDDPRYRKALFHLLTAQTSGFGIWGQGLWADYGRELCRRASESMNAL